MSLSEVLGVVAVRPAGRWVDYCGPAEPLVRDSVTHLDRLLEKYARISTLPTTSG